MKTHSLSSLLEKRLDELKKENLHRSLRPLESAPGPIVMHRGKSYVNFSSNNYLDLSGDSRLRTAASEALVVWGAGATASRLLGGTLDLHSRLEKALSELKGTEAAVVFPSGYHANLGTLPALAGPDDTVILDRLCHASLVDGARLSRAKLRVFRHNDMEVLEKILKRESGQGEKWIVTESVFSMDGDTAPLSEIVDLAERYGARVYVDEAHATGVWGPEGRGFVNALGLEKRVDVCMGTLSKALGSLGGYVCGTRVLVEWLHNRCRSFIYSTALSPADAAAALEAIAISRREEWRREKLFSLSTRLRRGLAGLESKLFSAAMKQTPFPAARGPIVPFTVGDEKTALRLAEYLLKNGILAPAIRPPTVPKGAARLRFSLTAGHTEAQVDAVLSGVGKFNRENHAG